MHEQGKAAMWCGLLLFTAPAAGAVTPPTFGPPRAGHGRPGAFSVLALTPRRDAGALTGRRGTGLLAALRARVPRTRLPHACVPRTRLLYARLLCARPPRGLWPISAPPRH
ncbi:hypothetical protein [Streptomyces decoyicus]|uniref:hypothetical protein n=1 Tax=Streptomyces decoyicus TaxID=249567 RepID=UPI0004AB8C28|nr:hypothetical protein [Streptomyces decoyicus]KOG48680.1 hypothetical protein ADK74_07965 [Streptomyces decoyicus]QZY15663.1 hypothetical protein K7C20_10630 [Streptomyces decoyicus]